MRMAWLLPLLAGLLLTPAAAQAPGTRGAVVGQPAPELGVKDLQGRTWRLQDLKADRTYVLYFWATWCSACREVTPLLKDLYEKRGSDNWEWVTISLDDDMAALRRYVRANPGSHLQLVDPEGELAARWRTRFVPTVIVLRNGKVLARESGKLTRPQLQRLTQLK